MDYNAFTVQTDFKINLIFCERKKIIIPFAFYQRGECSKVQ